MKKKDNGNYNIYIFSVLWLKECAKQIFLIYLTSQLIKGCQKELLLIHPYSISSVTTHSHKVPISTQEPAQKEIIMDSDFMSLCYLFRVTIKG